jgi:hypothetical protein
MLAACGVKILNKMMLFVYYPENSIHAWGLAPLRPDRKSVHHETSGIEDCELGPALE